MKEILAKDLGKAHKTHKNYRVYLEAESGLFRIYYVCRELVWSDMNMTYKVGKRVIALPVGYISDINSFESACEDLDSEYRAIALAEQKSYAKAGK